MNKHLFGIPILLLLMALAFAINAQTKSGLVVHEWGTFTSLQGSNGVEVEGLNHEEEALPSFVHGRIPNPETSHTENPRPCFKCFDFSTDAGTPFAVTQKMETPVLYFYSDTEQKVSLDIHFNEGVISQYFPKPASFSPPVGLVQSLKLGSNVHYDIDIKKGTLPLPEVGPENIYAPSRDVNSNYITTGSENEKFIFYRGIGDFSTALHVTSIGSALKIENSGFYEIPNAFLLQTNVDLTGSIMEIGKIRSKQSININDVMMKNFLGASVSADTLTEVASDKIVRTLDESGLYHDESVAMINTWKKSYFKTPGLRVLYVLSRAETDQILPIKVSPQPDQLVRTLIGRVEVLSDSEEQYLLEAAKNNFVDYPLSFLGRLAESKLIRISQLTQDGEVQKNIQLALGNIRNQSNNTP